MRTARRRIGILIYDGVTALDVVGPADSFASAEQPGNEKQRAISAYEVLTIGLRARGCSTESGIRLQASHLLAEAPTLDTIIVPGGSGLRVPAAQKRAAEWLRARSTSTRRIASVCTGIYALAASGLLDGRRVTTHWRYAHHVAQCFPHLQMQANAIFVKDGSFYTSAGVTAGIDLSLALIEEDFGASVALAVARELVVYLRRSGGQEQFSEPLRWQANAPEHFSDLVAHITAHLDGDLSVPALARKFATSPRQFTRKCKEALACAPGTLVQRMRLDEGKLRLHAVDARVDQVAASVGFRSADAFRRAFEQRFGLNPTAYQAHFQSVVKQPST